VKTRREFEWVIDATSVAGMVVGTTIAAHGQSKNTAGCEAGGKEWLGLIDKDHDGTVSLRELQDMAVEFKEGGWRPRRDTRR
jgi:hypothetical protein